MAYDPKHFPVNLPVHCPFTILQPQLRSAGEKERENSLKAILAKCSEVPAAALKKSNEVYWGEHFFNLHLSANYHLLSPDSKMRLLKALGTNLLKEAQWIEVAGTTYSAKMALLSETLEQRELYSFFSADEARHLRMISAFIGEPTIDGVRENPFLNFLGQLIQEEERSTLVFLIQVILEGWGISHYSSMARASLNPEVANSLRAIVQDEARHHGSGLILFDEAKLGFLEFNRIKNLLSQFLEMVRIGPLGVLNSLARETGHLSKKEVQQFLIETKFEIKIANDLSLMEGLLQKAGALKLHSQLQAKGIFKVPSLSTCAENVQVQLGVVA